MTESDDITGDSVAEAPRPPGRRTFLRGALGAGAAGAAGVAAGYAVARPGAAGPVPASDEAAAANAEAQGE